VTTLRPAPPPVPYTLDELRALVIRWSRKADWSIGRYDVRLEALTRMAAGDPGLLRILKRDDTELNEAGNQVAFRTAHAARLANVLANELKMREMGLL
jgi:hypothetical protein